MGKLRKPLGKARASLPIEVAGRPAADSQAFVGVGGDKVLIALTAIFPGFLEMFALTEGEKICFYGNLISSFPKLSPQEEIISEITKEFVQISLGFLGTGLEAINDPPLPGQ